MILLRFPAPRRDPASIGERLALVEARLAECGDRHRRIHEEGRRLAAAARRLRTLARRMARSQSLLCRSIGRLRDVPRSILPLRPGV